MTQTFENTWRRHIRRTFQLALPVMLARVGIVTMTIVDVIVLGRASADQLANYVLGEAIYGSIIAALVGVLLGVPVLTARAVGADEAHTAGHIWRRGMLFGVVAGVALGLPLMAAPQFFELVGQEAELAAAAGAVTRVLAFGLPFLAIYIVSTTFLEALGRPLAGTIAIGIANLTNLGLNVVLVFGWGPIPPLGAIGCALATAANTTLLAIGLAAYIRFIFPLRHRFGVHRPTSALWRGAVEQRSIGYAAASSYMLEAGSFAVMTVFVGYLGTVALAAHGVVFQFLAFTFMIAYGIAGATQVRVGNAWGRRDPLAMVMAGWTGLILSTAITATAAVLYAVFPGAFLSIFTDEATIVATALPVLFWAGLILVFDGGQAVINNACRGRGDTWAPTALHVVSYWLIMVPCAALFAFTLGHGLAGIYQGILAASIFSLAALGARFAWLSYKWPLPRERRDVSAGGTLAQEPIGANQPAAPHGNGRR